MAASLRRRARLQALDHPALAAERLGYEVRREYLGRGVRGHSERGSRIIRIASTLLPAQQAWTLCHELLECALPAAFYGRARERACQRGAAALMLPPIPYTASVWAAAWDLPRLRELWPWASWEALAFRFVDLHPWARCCIWADGWTLASGHREPDPEERDARSEAMDLGSATVTGRSRYARAWRVDDESGVRAVSVSAPLKAAGR